MLKPIALALLVLGSAAVASAEPTAADFAAANATVQVTDQSGKPLSSMLVTAVSRDYGTFYRFQTDDRGQAVFHLVAGTWSFYAGRMPGSEWGDNTGTGYLLAAVGRQLRGGNETIRLSPTQTTAVVLNSDVVSFDGPLVNTAVGFVVEPDGMMAQPVFAGIAARGAMQLFTNSDLSVRAYIATVGSAPEQVCFVDGLRALSPSFAIEVNAANTSTVTFEFPVRAPGGQEMAMDLQLQNSALTYVNSNLSLHFGSGDRRLRVSRGQWSMVPALGAMDASGLNWFAQLAPWTLEAPDAGPYPYQLGGRLSGRAMMQPRAADFRGALSLFLLHVEDEHGNTVNQIYGGGNRVDPVFVVTDSEGAYRSEYIHQAFVSMVSKRFDRLTAPRYSVSWDFGPWDRGNLSGSVFGIAERKLAIDQTPRLFSYGPAIARERQRATMRGLEELSVAMEAVMGIPTDWKQHVQFAHPDTFEDTFNMGYLIPLRFSLDRPSHYRAGDLFQDHESSHGRINLAPTNFVAVGIHGEQYVTYLAAVARAHMIGDDDRLLKSWLGEQDHFVRYRNQPWQTQDWEQALVYYGGLNWMHSHYGFGPQRRFITEFENSFQSLRSALQTNGYTQDEEMAVLLSYLTGENQGALFQATGFPTCSSARIQAGLNVIRTRIDTYREPSLAIGRNQPVSAGEGYGPHVYAPELSVPVNLLAKSVDASEISFTLKYDASALTANRAYTRDLTFSSGWGVSADLRTPGVAKVTLKGALATLSLGAIAQVNFTLKPGAAGTFAYQITDVVINGAARSGGSGTLVTPDRPVIGPFPDLPGCRSGAPYSFQLWAVAGTPPYRWSIVEDALPAGLTLDAGGQIRGTCSGTGDFPVHVRLTDSAGKKTQRWFRVISEPGSCSFTVSRQEASAGADISRLVFDVAATGEDCPRTASSPVSWARVTTGEYSLGPGVVEFTLERNHGAERTATVSIAGQAVVIRQVAEGSVPDAPGVSPRIQSGGVVDAASYSARITPGAFASIFGSNLAVNTESWTADSSGKLATEVGGARVRIGGVAAAISFASPGQLNVLVPASVVEGQVPVLVEVGGVASAPVMVSCSRVNPALYALPEPGSNPVRYLVTATVAGTGLYVGDNRADSRVSRGARPGEEIDLWAFGLGPTVPEFPTGSVFSGAFALPAFPAVQIGSVAVQPSWAGLVLPGMYMLRLKVPEGTVPGLQSIVLQLGSSRSAANVFLKVE